MAYATVSDVVSSMGGTTQYDNSFIGALVADATAIMDGYFDKDGVDPDDLDDGLLRVCCVEMVRPQLRVLVGDDYGSEPSYEPGLNQGMDMPAKFKELFGVGSRRAKRAGFGRL